jgi:hypothetical protein
MRFFRTTVMMLLCVWPGYGQSTSGLGSPDIRALQTKVDVYIKPFVDIKGFSGAILIARRGEVLIRKGYGMANYELAVPNTSQSIVPSTRKNCSSERLLKKSSPSTFRGSATVGP